MLQDYDLHMIEGSLKAGNNSIIYEVSAFGGVSDLRFSICKLNPTGGTKKLYTLKVNELSASKQIFINRKYAICLLYILREISLSSPLIYRLKQGEDSGCFRTLGKGSIAAKAIIPIFKKPNKFVKVKTTSIIRGNIRIYTGPKDGPPFTLSYSSVLDELLFKETTHEQNI